MVQLSARRALEYAISPPTLRLLGVVLLGWVLLPVGASLVVSGPFRHGGGVFLVLRLVQWLVGVVLALVGVLALYGGLVALLYKIIVDANAAAEP